MYIKELIAQLQGHQENVSNDMMPIYETPEVCNDAAEALLAQQVVIERMREALLYAEDHASRAGFVMDARIYSKALALQPDLSALREHDVEVIRAAYREYKRGTMLTQGCEFFEDYAERIRKGE